MLLNKIAVNLLAYQNVFKKITYIDKERPVVVWHGMGDSFNSTSMQRIFDIIHDVDPSKFTHSVYIDEDNALDQRASIIGNVNDQIDLVCAQLQKIPELSDGFDFIGFSQGGLFARAAIEKCGLNVHTLVTFGSPHAGVSDLPKCADYDWFCKRKNEVLKKQVFKDRVQKSIVASQYFRDPKDYQTYLEHSRFLAYANNEIPEQRNQTYADNLSRLERLVLIQFRKDETLVPRESAWFYDTDSTTGLTVSFEESDFYKNDWVGLKKLYDENKIEYLTVNEEHMSFSEEFFIEIIEKYLRHSTKE